MPMCERDFAPPWPLRSPHAQTLWPFLFRQRLQTGYLAETFELPDGDFLDLNWSQTDSDKTVLLIHGLEGSIESHYVGGLMARLEAGGYRPVFMHFRGCSGRINRLPRAYHSGDTGDIAEVVKHIEQQTGAPVFAAIGFSLGANALLKWLGQSGTANPLQRAVAVSVPFQLADAARRLNEGLSRFYREYLLRSLKNSYQRKFATMPSPLKVDLQAIKTLWQYDEAITAPLHGFDGADHYYHVASSRQYLHSIVIPTCIIHARDDPFMYPHNVPVPSELSPSIDLRVSAFGGHVGFVEWRRAGGIDYWHERQIMDFLVASG